jgi:hypothetical protein
MKRNISLALIAVFSLAAATAQAQIGNIRNKITDKVKTGQTPKKDDAKTDQTNRTQSVETSNAKSNSTDPLFLFVGANDLSDKETSEFRVCADNFSGPNPLRDKFKQWIDEISDTAMLRMLEAKRCELLGYKIVDNPPYKYRNADSLGEMSRGRSVYKVEGDRLVLVKKFEAAQFFIVVVPDRAKAGLKLAELRLCGSPETIKLFRRKTESVSNCHNLDQSLYVFESYKNYPGPMQTNSVIFNSVDFETLSKQDKFKGLVIYKLVGEELVPF